MSEYADLIAIGGGTILTILFFAVIGVLFLIGHLYLKNQERAALTKRLAQPETRITEWKSGYRCPTCGDWTDGWARNLGGVVCEACGSPAGEYEVVKFRIIERLDEDGWYEFDRAIDMTPVKLSYGECDYCGTKPCGCGATYNYLEMEESESV